MRPARPARRLACAARGRHWATSGRTWGWSWAWPKLSLPEQGPLGGMKNTWAMEFDEFVN